VEPDVSIGLVCERKFQNPMGTSGSTLKWLFVVQSKGTSTAWKRLRVAVCWFAVRPLAWMMAP
jgi:hypothetical protein